MIKTTGEIVRFEGVDMSTAPAVLEAGQFSFGVGGVPIQGSPARLPGKTLRDLGATKGAIISIYQFGNKIVVQSFVDVTIYDVRELNPSESDFVTDSFGTIVKTSLGEPLIA